jgi:dynein heavy chain
VRDFANIIQYMLLALGPLLKGNPLGLQRMWAHECHRVWQDRLINEPDRVAYMGFMKTALREFGDAKEDAVFEEPNIFTSYVAVSMGNEPAYLPITGMEALKEILERKLDDYNESNQRMDLVLFNAAIEHISRIARIIDLPTGSALLVGVGGSGKQSLSKLSSFLLGYDVERIMVNASYKMSDLKGDI